MIAGVLCQRKSVSSIFSVIEPKPVGYAHPHGRFCDFSASDAQFNVIAFKTESKSSGKWVLPITLTKTLGTRCLFEIYVINSVPVGINQNVLSFIFNGASNEWVHYVDANGMHPYLPFPVPMGHTFYVGVDVDAHTFFVSDGTTTYANLPMTAGVPFDGFIVKCGDMNNGFFEGSVEVGTQSFGDYFAV